MRMRLFVFSLTAFLLVGVGSQRALAQTTGTIFGTVGDESKAVIPGVTVTVKNVDTGLTRPVVTDTEGRYSAANLPLGNYEIQAELMGFQPALRKGIVLTVGREAQVNFTLKVGDLAETIVVTGEAPLVNTQSAAMAQVVDTQQIQDLPLNARDFVQLATLQPGVSIVATGASVDETGGGSSGAAGRGLGVKLTISGARTNSNSFQLDGTDVNDYANTTPGSITGSNLGVEAIREFRVLTNTFSAEYGRSAGGVITAVSRSGTNEFHGSVFEFHRNEKLDAPNYFDKATGREKPDFMRNQFGVAVGGRVIRNKLFFFGNYEGQRSTAGINAISPVLTAAARQGNLTSGQVTVHPNIQPILALYPLPNGQIRGDVGDFVVNAEADIREDFVMAKVDHQLSGKHNYFVRHTFSDASIQSPDPLKIHLTNAGSQRNFTTFDWKAIMTARLMNSATFAVNRTEVVSGELIPQVDLPGISFVPGRPMGDIIITGMAGFPGDVGAADKDLFQYTVYQFRDDVTWTRGRHGVKFGFNFERMHMDMDSTNQQNGNFRFDSIRDFLENKPGGFRGQAEGSSTTRGFRQHLIALYVQDDIRLTDRLTLNAGLRYEFITEITEVDGKIGNLRNFTDAEYTQGKLFENPSLKNFAPRVGLAWDPTGDGRTAIRGGFGVYHDQILSHYFTGGFGVRTPPFFRRASLSGSGLAQGDFPTGAYAKFLAGGSTALEGEWFEFNPDQPTALQWNVNAQHQLPGNFVVMAGYVGYQGSNLKRIAEDGNLRIPVTLPDGRLFFPHAGKNPCPIAQCVNTPRENPNFAGIKTGALDGESSYHSLQLGVSKRFSGGLQFQTSYTLSKALDDSSGVFNEKDLSNSNNYPYFWDPDFNWGPADFDLRHNLMVNYTYHLPIPDMSGVAGVLLNGWQWSGILRASSGNPYTPVLGSDQARTLSGRGAGGQRPSVPEGHNGLVESTGDPDGWFDRNQFVFPEAGFFGNLGRGTGTGDGLVTFDTTLTKNTYFTASRYVQFRIELFNALDQVNFSNPGRPTVFNSQGLVIPTAGRITSTSTRARQIQLSVKFYF